ncbi:MAG: aminodeoxychorismate/anthranilate synthase component II [Pseudomonadota bacterium]
MLILIDNYDSFTYNLVQYFGELGENPKVFRNDQISVPGLEKHAPDYLVISPGPRTPNEAGISVPAIRHFADKVPILGICLGHQSIAQAFGGQVIPAKSLMHGKVSDIHHNQTDLFVDIPNPMRATRYHSLSVCERTLPNLFEITATSPDNEIMAIRHREYPIFGFQFHPESIESAYGHDLLANFLAS